MDDRNSPTLTRRKRLGSRVRSSDGSRTSPIGSSVAEHGTWGCPGSSWRAP